MFISVLDLFKIGIGPSSSHTMGPMVAAKDFRDRITVFISDHLAPSFLQVRCTLRGSLAFTGKGHATDRAVTLGMHKYTPRGLAKLNVNELFQTLWQQNTIRINESTVIHFNPPEDIIFDRGEPLPEHPNGMIFQLLDETGKTLLTETYFSIGGGFITTLPEIGKIVAPIKMEAASSCGFPFDSANQMMKMSADSGLSIAAMKRSNELERISEAELNAGLDAVWDAMRTCLENGLVAEGRLPGGLNIKRRAHSLHLQLQENPQKANLNDWLCAYAMAVNEENAAGHMVVTAPTNGAAGVIPAVIYYAVKHEGATPEQVRDFLLVAGAIGGLIKHNSSISGAEVGCQGEVGVACSMAAGALTAVLGGSLEQIENAAEMAMEHHLGMTCDPVAGLVQIPCIERNGVGAEKAIKLAYLALMEDGKNKKVSLDKVIETMFATGKDMMAIYKETSLGGLAKTLAVNVPEC